MENQIQTEHPYEIRVNWMSTTSSFKLGHRKPMIPVIMLRETKYSESKRISLKDAIPYINDGIIPLTEDLKNYMIKKGFEIFTR